MSRNWTEPELLIAMNLYCKLPFGHFDQSNKTVRKVAAKIGRTPGSLAMKLSNLASLDSYEYTCAISGMCVQQMLVASHIIPRHADESRRADPTNGLCLNALYDHAFDRGLIAFDEELRIMVSSVLKHKRPPVFQQTNFIAIEGAKLRLPHRFHPDIAALGKHRETIFVP